MSIVEVPRRVSGKIQKTAASIRGKKHKQVCKTSLSIPASVAPPASSEQHPLAEIIGYLQGEIWQEIRQERERERQEIDRLAALE